MKRVTLVGFALLFAASAGAQGQTAPKYKAKVPPSITTPDTVQTRIGTPKFTDGMPDIGRRPIASFGNSDGDLQMLQWTCAGSGARFCLFVRHTDGDREWNYDVTPLGRLEKGLVEANAKGWTVVDMKADWKVIYPFEKK